MKDTNGTTTYPPVPLSYAKTMRLSIGTRPVPKHRALPSTHSVATHPLTRSPHRSCRTFGPVHSRSAIARTGVRSRTTHPLQEPIPEGPTGFFFSMPIELSLFFPRRALRRDRMELLRPCVSPDRGAAFRRRRGLAVVRPRTAD